VKELVPKKHVAVKDGELVVTVDTVADHRLALRELKLLKSEFRLQKKEAAALVRPEVSLLKLAARKRFALPGDPSDAAMLPVMRSNKYREMAENLEARVRSFDSLIRAVESMEIQVRAGLYREQYK
jgi:hypothetical protein